MIQWLFPPKCPVCMGLVIPKGAFVHEACGQVLHPITEPVCKCCGRQVETEEEELCSVCQVTERRFDMGRSLYPYRGAAGRAVRMIKNEGTEEFVRFFATQFVNCQKQFLTGIGNVCIVPVPLHKSKLCQRGFNQAELLARALEKETGFPLRLLLQKVKKTKEQKSLTLEQRRKNLVQVFRVVPEEQKRGLPERVLLVDDVFTTGSTLTACADVLKNAGVKQVYFLTVCSGE